MRTPYAVVFILVILVAGTYMYREVEAVCDVPLSYRIGQLDERFGISMDEARVAISDAESVWEQATGRNLFTYDATADFPINFIFDERQQFAVDEIEFREKLDTTQGANSEIGDTYAVLVERYNTLDIEYKNNIESYERRLFSYNSRVKEYNEQGGAPEDEYKSLQSEQRELDKEVKIINSFGQQLNDLSKEINQLSEEGNQLVEVYNQNVETYNDTFGDSREFTQGDYQGDRINIYKFVDMDELELVLSHEMGHALSLDHVEDDAAILNYQLGEQSGTLRLTEPDLNEFERVCGESTRSFIERLLILFGI